MRAALCAQGFLEIETPILTKSTPEGARDFLVPSRLQPGSFYALPQSPQIMKQLLMVAGFDRYFQIARCFRDEDQRADRQLEFTQVDLELAFATVEEVLEVLEAVTVAGCAVAGLDLPRPFPRITYREAIDRYGVDRPDTRITLELVDLTDAFATSEFRAFRQAVDAGGIVKCLPIHDAATRALARSDRQARSVREEGARRQGAGLGARRRRTAAGSRRSRNSSPTPSARRSRSAPGAARQRALLPGRRERARQRDPRAAARRPRRAARPRRRPPHDVLFVVDFPLFERDEKGGLTYVHQPFVAPLDEDLARLESESGVGARHALRRGDERRSSSARAACATTAPTCSAASSS